MAKVISLSWEPELPKRRIGKKRKRKGRENLDLGKEIKVNGDEGEGRWTVRIQKRERERDIWRGKRQRIIETSDYLIARYKISFSEPLGISQNQTSHIPKSRSLASLSACLSNRSP